MKDKEKERREGKGQGMERETRDKKSWTKNRSGKTRDKEPLGIK